MPDAIILETKNLTAFYDDFQALFSVDITLQAGEVIAIIGANGAGKTTLMSAITGLLSCAPNMVQLRGAPIGGASPASIAYQGIAMVPEGRQLFPSLSVEENLIIGGQTKRPGNWNLQKIYELFPILANRRSQKSTSLSGGQQQMVAIGRALMANPDVLLLDELSLGLAPIIINDIYNSLPDIIGEGVSAILVEQDITRALAVSDRAYCIQEGRISLTGKSDGLSRKAVNEAYFGV